MDITQRVSRFLRESWRIIRILKKPSKEEFKVIVKVSGIGMLVIGFIGFVLQLGKQLLF